jgi:hypothetical protein
MPELAAWRRQTEAWTDTVLLRRDMAQAALAGLAEKGRDATDALSARASDLARDARSRFEDVETAVADLLRRRYNLLQLATRQDVETQSRIGRRRVSTVLNEFLASQRAHDEALVRKLRSEIRSELATFMAAQDDVAATEEALLAIEPRSIPRRGREELDYLLDDDLDFDDDLAALGDGSDTFEDWA